MKTLVGSQSTMVDSRSMIGRKVQSSMDGGQTN